MSGTPPTPDRSWELDVELPGVLSWSRPRPGRGRVRYEGVYGRERDTWALCVRRVVLDEGWAPPATARYRVDVWTYGGGKRDLDRVCTAVLDALENGGVYPDDCRVDHLRATRHPKPEGEDARTRVKVTRLWQG